MKKKIRYIRLIPIFGHVTHYSKYLQLFHSNLLARISIKKALATILAIGIIMMPINGVAMAIEPLSFLDIPAKGAVVIDASNNRILYQKNADQPLPMASTTKIMTALITLEQENLDEYFTVDSDAIKVEGSSMGLQEGDSVSLRALATGMLLSSGNDAANAAAVRISGSEEAFLELMNQFAKEIGMQDTAFFSISGLDVGDHHSTAYDMAILASYALRNNEFAEISSSKQKRIAYGNPPYNRTLTNHNKLLWNVEGAIGMKTGFTKKSGRCLVSAVIRDSLTIVTVTLGCYDDFNTHAKIYDQVFNELEFFDVSHLIEEMSIPITGAQEQRLPITTQGALGGYLTSKEEKYIKLEILTEPFLYAPIKKGQAVGEVMVYIDDVMISKAMLVAREDRAVKQVEKKGILDWIKGMF